MASATTVVHHDIPEIRLQFPLLCGLSALLLYVAISSLLQSSPGPALAVRQNGSELRIAWNRTVAAGGAILDIIDGTEHTAIFIPPTLATVTYMARTAAVDIQLGGMARGSRVEIARYAIPEAYPIAMLRQQFEATRVKAAALEAEIGKAAGWAESLDRRANRLLAVAPQKKSQPAKSAAPTRWWR